MLTFRQMESFNAVVDSINQMETLIRKIDSGIAAHRTDTIPSRGTPAARKVEDQIILRENAERKLERLRRLRDDNLPFVQDTIREATRQSKPSVRLKRQLLLKMRYEQGRDWIEIQDILKIEHPEKIVMELLEGKDGTRMFGEHIKSEDSIE